MRGVLKHRGFTLIELLITLVVLVVLISLAAPQMGQFVDQRRLVGAAEAVYSHLQLARTEAVKQSRDMHISFGGSGTAWCVGFTDDTSGCNCSEATVIGTACTILADSNTVRVLARITADPFTNVTMDSSPADDPISIDYVRGVIDPLGTHSTTLRSARGRELQVSIGPLGRTQICSPTGPTNVPGYPEC